VIQLKLKTICIKVRAKKKLSVKSQKFDNHIEIPSQPTAIS